LYDFTYFGNFRGGIWGGKKIFGAKYSVGFSGGKVKKWRKTVGKNLLVPHTPQK
jgi:hypothetical protein